MSRRIFLIAASILCGILTSAPQTHGHPKPSGQHFVCHSGFTLDQCHIRISILKRALDRYRADDLGEWSWVLVRTIDFERILSERGFNSDAPAFTYLPAKETFFDDALTSAESVRGIQLIEIWRMPIEELLDKAVRHELAHALCNEKDESKARIVEERLRSKAPSVCETPRT
jgi:hypothetical protein